MTATTVIEAPVRDAIERELAEVAQIAAQPPDLEEFRGRMPKANGDQDTW